MKLVRTASGRLNVAATARENGVQVQVMHSLLLSHADHPLNFRYRVSKTLAKLKEEAKKEIARATP